MDLDQAVSRPSRDIVAGVGFRHATQAEEIVTLVGRGLAACGHASSRLRALATAEDRADEAAFHAAAHTLGCATIGLAAEALRAVDADVPTRSARMEAERGIGSLAEAAALAGAGAGGVLILPRIASAGATLALATVSA
ncbi:cobalamin biosynthesis protein [Methylobacterium gnaphalii]|uniref:Precorrin methylase n=1 Tax=Methylobacterium gnaphalii TaxID=1010610 RepID=A0A512JJB1_9HYPH|nr:cobalamin biosynthesis protein [Methylobacterium gnaphalii]GEP10024.1 precorrin methylase [Methylobacterium gnaphalii]GLS48294.1 precorrin methylase [Methylobacterium gnaphalii]